jgi:hypothetical protein
MTLIFIIFVQASPQANNMTVVVENPMTLDEEGKLVILLPVFPQSD